ncbi:hypothetical protein D3C78_803990 [compost metagenome]
MRYKQAHRPAVLVCKRLAIVAMRKQNIIVKQILQRQIRIIILIRMNHNIASFSLYAEQRKKILKLYPFPLRIELRPARNAVNIAYELRLRQRKQLIKAEAALLLHLTKNPQRPCAQIILRNLALMEDRKSLSQRLTGRYAMRQFRRNIRNFNRRYLL